MKFFRSILAVMIALSLIPATTFADDWNSDSDMEVADRYPNQDDGGEDGLDFPAEPADEPEEIKKPEPPVKKAPKKTKKKVAKAKKKAKNKKKNKNKKKG